MNLVKSIEEDKKVETRNPFVMLGVNLIIKTRWNHIYSSQSDYDSDRAPSTTNTNSHIASKYINTIMSNVSLCFSQFKGPT